ncbi:TusE/DsrC/DsvC family sulfur relay protein [Buchnera aphidicola (Taiwanaphis decaspermi)]|uniref:TusE/DsrC/DsvC family sulfur relay protein n=1 Tax=Buchnera aphidicola TaxID=9 RepID=UPI0031B7FA30
MKYKSKKILDKEGYLKNINIWNKSLAKKIAFFEKIKMKKQHWEIIYLVRNFYLSFGISPSIRIIMKILKKNNKYSKIDSSYLFKLFPKGPALQANKIAGLPKPSNCL